MTAHTISDVAERTGFSPSTLRYYEDVGVLAPHRNSAGYRLYDEHTVDRLHFVRRGKQLGLNLEEIAELLALWDGDRSAPVAHRLRALVADKLAQTHSRIAELVTFASQLQDVVSGLEGDPGDGACGPDCACHGGGAPNGQPVIVGLSAAPTEAPAVACTLAPEEMPDRLEAWQRIVTRAHARSRIDGGIRLSFAADPRLAGDIAWVAADEQAWCTFFEFTIRMTAEGVDLDVRAPDAAAPLVTAMFGSTS
jgi:DNA-binding transcriptional MerR regulator